MPKYLVTFTETCGYGVVVDAKNEEDIDDNFLDLLDDQIPEYYKTGQLESSDINYINKLVVKLAYDDDGNCWINNDVTVLKTDDPLRRYFDAACRCLNSVFLKRVNSETHFII